jgi:hypothetical protein
MTRLFTLIYALAGPSLAGAFIVVALTMNMVDLKSILVSAALGFGLGVPAAWIVARQLIARG